MTKKMSKEMSGSNKNLLKNAKVDVHDLKPNSKFDLFKNTKGEIFYKSKNGAGPGEPTGYNINDF